MIKYHIYTSIEEGENLWNTFSPKVELYDDWKFRFTYWNFTKPEICFVVGYENNIPFGLLPLQWNNDGYYEFFGGDFMSYNALFIKETFEHLKNDFLNQINKPIYLRWMRTPFSHPKLKTTEKSTFFLPVKNFTNLDDYFQNVLSPTRKKQIRKEMRKILKQDTNITFNNFDDLDLLVQLNKKRFGDNSVFNKPYRYEFFKAILKIFDAQIITVTIDGEKVGIGLRIIYNNTLYGINTGVKEGTANVGKFLYLKAIEFAIENKLEKYDALEGAYGWKEEFGFLGRPQYHLDLRN